MDRERKDQGFGDESDRGRESGMPGGGAGRIDEVGGSGVYPASGARAPLDAEVRTPAAWGQGERGAAGYEDSGSSELFFYDAELKAAGVEQAGAEAVESSPERPPRRERAEGTGPRRGAIAREVTIPVGPLRLEGTLTLPPDATGVVLFAHGSGSSRKSPRNRSVAGVLQAGGFGTLLFDLLSAEEEAADARTGHLRFDIDFLARRLVEATRWATREAELRELPVGYFGASTGAAAALVAAATLPDVVSAVVSRGGRPDLARVVLPQVRAPTLLIVGGRDVPVIGMNQEALDLLRIEKKLEIVPGATHLFEEPGALDIVARLATDWFARHLGQRAGGAQPN